jgi:gamma-glutamylputrescine oxidase
MGSGVSFSMHAGKRIAERIGGEPGAIPEAVSKSLPRFPLAAFRRLGQRVMMRWYTAIDSSG